MKKKNTRKSFYPGYNFGMKKTIVETYASQEEIKRFVDLLDQIQIQKLQIHRLTIKNNYGSEEVRRLRVDAAEIRAELRE